MSEESETLAFKYADAVEHVLREGEPFFLVRAQDKFATFAVSGYAQGLYSDLITAGERGDKETAAQLEALLDQIRKVLTSFQEWQESNSDLLKIPD